MFFLFYPTTHKLFELFKQMYTAKIKVPSIAITFASRFYSISVNVEKLKNMHNMPGILRHIVKNLIDPTLLQVLSPRSMAVSYTVLSFILQTFQAICALFL